MKVCQHRNVSPKGKSVHCWLVDIGVPIKQDPCEQCQSEWVDGKVPTPETLTPTLLALQKQHAGIVEVKPVQLPPLIVRLKNFATAFAKHLAAGGKKLDKEATQERLSICEGCEHKTTYFMANVCGICGCALKLKASWPEQVCPIKKWPGDKDKPGCGKPCGGSNK